MVDADRQARVLAAQLLAGLGFRVALADNAAEALRTVADDRRFHAVLADATLPDMDGTELATRIRDIAAGLRVILIGDQEASGAAGAYFEFLPRQFGSEQLSRILGPAS